MNKTEAMISFRRGGGKGCLEEVLFPHPQSAHSLSLTDLVSLQFLWFLDFYCSLLTCVFLVGLGKLNILSVSIFHLTCAKQSLNNVFF